MKWFLPMLLSDATEHLKEHQEFDKFLADHGVVCPSDGSFPSLTHDNVLAMVEWSKSHPEQLVYWNGARNNTNIGPEISFTMKAGKSSLCGIVKEGDDLALLNMRTTWLLGGVDVVGFLNAIKDA